ncbi:class I SAM-dependent methyltransferase [Stratiformator vulcanicus]|uniref:class I SAM-dependent methyltransferase n=1 Tax=Stratiformator vulcanicus TaxID=2527980 RepID=UPI0011A58EC4|nr:class I SAM-dependent methyltransferase [Stratiformator vulcanicus]
MATERNKQHDRLNPRRTSRVYWHLRCLKEQTTALLNSLDLSDKAVIDLGCGSMPYRPLVEDVVKAYIGVDLANNWSADIHLNEDFTVPLDDDCADIVLSNQVLEHVRDPTLYLSECRRLLRPEGRLLLSTHGIWRFHGHPEDFWRWTSLGLPLTLERSGFQVLESRAIMGPAATGLQLFQDAIAPRVPHIFKPIVFFFSQLIIEAFDRITPQRVVARDASVYVVLASLPSTASDASSDR